MDLRLRVGCVTKTTAHNIACKVQAADYWQSLSYVDSKLKGFT